MPLADDSSPALLIGLHRYRTRLRAVVIDTAGSPVLSLDGDETLPLLATIASRLGLDRDRVIGIGIAGTAVQASDGAPPVVLAGRNPRRWLPAAARDALALGAIPAIDTSLASGDARFDLAAARWDEDLLATLGIDPRQLPPAVPPGARTGSLSDAAAAATGLPPGIALAAPTDRYAAIALAARATLPHEFLVARDASREVVAIVPVETVAGQPRGYRNRLRLHVAPGLGIVGGPLIRGASIEAMKIVFAADLGVAPDAPLHETDAWLNLPAYGAALIAGIAAGEFVDVAAARRAASVPLLGGAWHDA